MKKFGIIYHPYNQSAIDEAEHVNKLTIAAGHTSWVVSAWDVEAMKKNIEGTEAIITCGGDGTVLRAAQVAACYAVPIVGINHGTLGFLTEIPADKVNELMVKVFNGEYRLDERNEINIAVTQPGKETEHFHALNDVVIARGEMARLVGINAEIDGKKLTYFKADGILCSTATGSTGYNYACHGAVMYPSSKDMQLVAIVPHLTFDHPIIVSGDSVIRITIHSGYSCSMNVDGHVFRAIEDNTEFVISKSELKVNFIRLSNSSFFETLTTKLRTRI